MDYHLTVSEIESVFRDPNYKVILEGTASGTRFLKKEDLQERVSIEEVVRQFNNEMDRDYKRVLKSIQRIVGSEQNAIQSIEGWKQSCRAKARLCKIFLYESMKPANQLYRYYKDARGALGYVIVENDSMRYWFPCHYRNNQKKQEAMSKNMKNMSCFIDDSAILLRTDFSDQEKWDECKRIICNPDEPFICNINFVEDIAFLNKDPINIKNEVPMKYLSPVLFVADKLALQTVDFPCLVLGLNHNRDLSFRALAKTLPMIENNLSIANEDFEEFMAATGPTGIFLGDGKPLRASEGIEKDVRKDRRPEAVFLEQSRMGSAKPDGEAEREENAIPLN